MPNITPRKYSCIRDTPDSRDFKFSVAPVAVLPTVVDLRPKCPSIYDQSSLGSCTANAIGGAFEFDQIKQNIPHWTPSRLFIYYNERLMEGTIDQDAGAQIRDGVKVINQYGVCAESVWEYIPTQFTIKPSALAYSQAKLHPALQYHSVVQSLITLKQALANGFPMVCGISIYESFESQEVADTGMVPMPTATEQFLGGHAVLIVGFDDSKQCFIMRNSWGVDWGIQGYFYMPYSYITDQNLASDFWVITLVK